MHAIAILAIAIAKPPLTIQSPRGRGTPRDTQREREREIEANKFININIYMVSFYFKTIYNYILLLLALIDSIDEKFRLNGNENETKEKGPEIACKKRRHTDSTRSANKCERDKFVLVHS